MRFIIAVIFTAGMTVQALACSMYCQDDPLPPIRPIIENPFPPQASDNSNVGVDMVLRMQEVDTLNRAASALERRPIYAPLAFPGRVVGW